MARPIAKYTVTPRGGTYQCTVTSRLITSGRERRNFKTNDEADKWGAEQVYRLTNGQPVEASKKKDSKPFYLADLMDWTYEQRWSRKVSGNKILIHAKAIVSEIGPKTPVHKVDYFTIETAITRLTKARDWQPATGNRCKAAISVMLKEAQKLDLIDKKPVIEKVSEQNRREARIPRSLEAKMLAWAWAMGHHDLHDMLVFGLWIGARLNELLRIRYQPSTQHPNDPHLTTNNMVVFPAPKVANKGLHRAISLVPVVQAVIQRRRAKATGPYIFQGVSRAMVDHQFARMREALKDEPEIVEQGGHDKFVFHSCRHEFGSRLGDAGKTATEIMQEGGWKTMSQVSRYVKPELFRQRSAIADIAGGDDIPEYMKK